MTANSTSNMKILFIGGGKMMQAIAGGLMVRGLPAANLFAIEPDDTTRLAVAGLGVQVAASMDDSRANLAAIDVVILAVKPQVMTAAIAPLANRLTHQLVLSIAAGVRIMEIARWLGYARIVRAMPNTPALIQAGMTGLYAPIDVDVEGRATAESLLTAIGKTAWFDDESMLDAVTAVSGSGPAYVFYAIEALEASAIELGFSAEAARQFALETFRGAALLAAQSTDSPAQLRANVTSKGGTTEAAIAVFDETGVRTRFISGVRAAAARAKQLGDELGSPPRATEKGG